jgi:hypothetical protein
MEMTGLTLMWTADPAHIHLEIPERIPTAPGTLVPSHECPTFPQRRRRVFFNGSESEETAVPAARHQKDRSLK